MNTINLQQKDGKLVGIVITCNFDHINLDVRHLVHLWAINVNISFVCNTLTTAVKKKNKAINMKFYMMLCLQIAQTGTDKCIKNIFNHLEMSSAD